MNIKNTTIILAPIGNVGCSAFAQAEIPNAPQWEVSVLVVGEDRTPITEANVFASYQIPPPPGTTEVGSRKTGSTDTNGSVTLSAHSGPLVVCGADKTGYYSNGGLTFEFNSKMGGQWQPWNPIKTLILKKVVNPIPMYVKLIDSEPPAFKKTGRPPIVFSKSIGYDLMAGDWVAPYGKGLDTNIIFSEDFNKQSISDMDYKLTISFPNAGDGIQAFAVPDDEKYSGLRSPHEAPADGYQSELIRENYYHPGQRGKSDYDPNRNYFFRVRTTLDENGKVKTALYGKIYGDPEQMNFTYYLNPTPNDRNIEFDPKRNLFGGLQSFGGVNAP
jgi:hypothetical protein